MFERFTEKARRTIFFARYEAAQAASPFIETEHLLLGLLREGREVLMQLLSSDQLERLHAELEHKAESPHSLTVDLPLSPAAKRALAHAAEEAQFLNHRHIGTEHLLLGLLCESDARAAQALAQHGVNIEQARLTARNRPPPPEPPTEGRRSTSRWQEGTQITETRVTFRGHELVIVEWLRLSDDGRKLTYATEIRGPSQSTSHAFEFDVASNQT